MNTWKLEDAKNRFSEVVRLALARQPQRVTRNGRDAVVVLSADEYDELVMPRPIVEYMQSSPLAKAIAAGEIDLERQRDYPRDVEF
ncbi:MAG TPA: type II toxin-antitoxin system Phd/YefM family antitoxin [Longimicrobium sp.]|nr:type II toxin-antitoxin system Phd/YefM family antitoxin [Longimicrobium sp.]